MKWAAGTNLGSAPSGATYLTVSGMTFSVAADLLTSTGRRTATSIGRMRPTSAARSGVSTSTARHSPIGTSQHRDGRRSRCDSTARGSSCSRLTWCSERCTTRSSSDRGSRASVGDQRGVLTRPESRLHVQGPEHRYHRRRAEFDQYRHVDGHGRVRRHAVISDVPTDALGWFIDLAAGEKVINGPLVPPGGALIFGTNQPCASGKLDASGFCDTPGTSTTLSCTGNLGRRAPIQHQLPKRRGPGLHRQQWGIGSIAIGSRWRLPAFAGRRRRRHQRRTLHVRHGQPAQSWRCDPDQRVGAAETIPHLLEGSAGITRRLQPRRSSSPAGTGSVVSTATTQWIL